MIDPSFAVPVGREIMKRLEAPQMRKTHKPGAKCPRCRSPLKVRYICLKCGRDPITTGKRTLGVLVYCQCCDHLFIDAFRPPTRQGYTQVFICPICRNEVELL